VAVREPDDGAVFSDHRVHEMKVPRHLLKLREDATGYDDNGYTSFSDFSNSSSYFGIQRAASRNRPVIVQG
jgi:hypothetical protein